MAARRVVFGLLGVGGGFYFLLLSALPMADIWKVSLGLLPIQGLILLWVWPNLRRPSVPPISGSGDAP